ncbi:MAG: ABC transporter permease [Paracoccus sp. (in: a-proteobacteria)]|uniref:ABC transporter permease n=1 Tax=Paracoccus sp. TaxID=267 RepID=UPI00391DD22A
MFEPRRPKTMLDATMATLALIHHQTAYKLRTNNRNALVGIFLEVSQSLVMVGILLAMYYLIGIRNAPIRGDFLLYILTGIFCFMTHVKSVGAVSGAHSISKGVLKHEPLNAFVLICAAALAALYQQTFALLIILGSYHLLFTPVYIYDPLGVAAMIGLAWFSGCCVGLVFLGIRPWFPSGSGVISTIYMRIQLILSGKMFVANLLPGFLLPWFIWNPLFHNIDQMRGYMFINYTPQRTVLLYPLYVAIAALMIGLLINFTTRKYESLSWSMRS